MQNTIETNKKRINSDLKKIDSDVVIRKKGVEDSTRIEPRRFDSAKMIFNYFCH